MAIRLIFLLLVFSNLVVWLFDPFGPAAADREPQHMAQQIHPEKLRIVHEAPVVNAPDPEPIPPAAKTPATAPVTGTGPAPAAATSAATSAATPAAVR